MIRVDTWVLLQDFNFTSVENYNESPYSEKTTVAGKTGDIVLITKGTHIHLATHLDKKNKATVVNHKDLEALMGLNKVIFKNIHRPSIDLLVVQ